MLKTETAEKEVAGEERMRVVESFITVNEWSRCGKKLLGVRGVVMHYVGVAGQKPWQTVAYFESLKAGKTGTYAGAHYVVGLDGEIINCIPKDEIAWHCGAKSYREGITERLGNYPNNTTIGIEMCHKEAGFTKETEEAAAMLAATLLKENGLTVGNLYRHWDITGKLCPLFYAGSEYGWSRFKNLVKGYMN